MNELELVDETLNFGQCWQAIRAPFSLHTSSKQLKEFKSRLLFSWKLSRWPFVVLVLPCLQHLFASFGMVPKTSHTGNQQQPFQLTQYSTPMIFAALDDLHRWLLVVITKPPAALFRFLCLYRRPAVAYGLTDFCIVDLITIRHPLTAQNCQRGFDITNRYRWHVCSHRNFSH